MPGLVDGVKQIVNNLSGQVASGLFHFMLEHNDRARSFFLDIMLQALNEFHMPRGTGRYALGWSTALALPPLTVTEGSIITVQGADDAIIDRIGFRLSTNPGAGLTTDLMINRNAVIGYDGLTVPIIGGNNINWTALHEVDIYVTAGSRVWWQFNNFAGLAGVAECAIRARRVPQVMGPTRR